MKGFTLIELLAVIIILSIIMLVTVPTINVLLSDSTDSLHDSQIKAVEKAAKEWSLDNMSSLNDNSTCVSVATLVSEGYFESQVIDPKTKEAMSGGVIITLNSLNQYSYEYDENGC